MNAQSLVISDLENIVYGEPSASVLTTHATVTNTSSAPVTVSVEGGHLSGAPVSANYYFCWFVCYSAIPVANHFQIPANHVITLAPGQDTSVFAAYYEPQGQVAIAEFEYCFTNADDVQDQTCVTITFDTQNVGVEEVFQATGSAISESYPNPANKEAKINYSLNANWETAEVTLYNMLGAKVKKTALKEKQGVLKMDVSTLPSGMYFYTLNVDGKSISTKKMMVTK